MTTTLLIQTQTTPLTVSLPATAPMTRDEFYAFCQANRDLRIERTATGEVVIMSPAFADTGNRNFNLSAHLWVWSKRDGTGLGFDSSAGFTLPNGATRSPDAAWIRADGWNALSEEEKASFAPIAPDFVIELRSASDTLSGLKAKMQEYIENGVRLGWLIDRQNRAVYIYRPDREPEVWENPDGVSGDPQLPGFSLPMAKIW
ncbi:MAG TPA: Uma2 family endonuclease [Oscillatoriales cyanobacterium M59_W2019_021]|nr:MAG: Uma2 family endonuclease [Cyanobacteria bacterium J055]HIK32908.1 Uma2 family endonuclease [Oscillatoriales cyanobacterium M4454_W2019_049]HIK52009.1 Uma2 family endonuclease [Oscillatoriales cyanobacterium M59_W2019_021]